MCKTLQVRWTITPQTAPQPWITCSGCGGLRAFRSSDRIRLNANGRKLDAWLIYKCLICQKTWNRPILERRNVRGIDPVILNALQSNDPDWIRAEAFNIEALRRKSPRVDEFAEFDITKQIRRQTADWTRLEIELMVPLPISTRLDRLLATELKVSRSRLQALQEHGKLLIDTDGAAALRRRIGNGARILIDLTTEADREQSWRPAATGNPL
ncbi:hypothetical protein ATY77_15700 [Rhizobium sp. R634]|uniref:DUF1062 domain-containing protein n=1 Tax=Rhizobium sp. R634 TaxID=1764274 RepID=UPI000B52A490|nr:hypothetical protein ATY77_15700 [Rhizobium sp. R634]